VKYQVKYIDVMDTQAVELPEGSIVIDADPLVKHGEPVADSRTWYQKLWDFPREVWTMANTQVYIGWRITYLEPVKEVSV